MFFLLAYSFYVSFTNWSTGHILTKQQAIERLEDRTYSKDDQKGVEFDIYIFQDQNLDFYFFADLDEDNLYFGKAIKMINLKILNILQLMNHHLKIQMVK